MHMLLEIYVENDVPLDLICFVRENAKTWSTNYEESRVHTYFQICQNKYLIELQFEIKSSNLREQKNKLGIHQILSLHKRGGREKNCI